MGKRLTLCSVPPSRSYPLDKVQDAYDSMMNNKARFRSVIVFDE